MVQRWIIVTYLIKHIKHGYDFTLRLMSTRILSPGEGFRFKILPAMFLEGLQF